MPPPRRRPDDRRDSKRDPYLSGVIDAEVLDAEVLDADVLDGEVLDADVLDGEILDATIVDAEILDAEPLELDDPPADDDDPPAVFDLDAISGPPMPGTTPAPALPVFEPPASASGGADLLTLDIDPPKPARRTTTVAATATRPAVRITFVAPGERSPFDPRG